MLEVRIPSNIIKRPKAMEQVFSGIYGIYSFGNPWIPKYMEGKVDLWVSFEIAAKGGSIRFYVRTPKSFRNLVESSIYGQYPEAEILEAEDYVHELPSSLPNETFDIWGTGFKLANEAPYPIRTYKEFDEFEPDDEKRIDPMSALFEAMSKLQQNERIWIQCMVSATGKPTGYDIQEEMGKIIQDIQDKSKEADKEGKITRKPPTHGTQEIIKGIENKASKHLFQFTLRFLYIAPKEEFNGQNIPAVMGSFQQFNTQNMNAFKPDGTITLMGGWLARLFPSYKNSKVLIKKRMLYDAYVQRQFGLTNRLSDTEKLGILSTEELATIYHYPIGNVKAPQLQRIGSRRSEPPVNLPFE